MINRIFARRRATQGRAAAPAVEGLEGRLLMAADFVGPVVAGGIVTLSARLTLRAPTRTDGPTVVAAAAPAVVFAGSYGAVGDGVADDAPALQRAIDAAPAGATLLLNAGTTYRLGAGLAVGKSLSIDGRGATLLLDTSSYPQNTHLTFHSTYAARAFTWGGAVAAGQSTLPVAVPATEVRVGDWVQVELGRDPYDPNESQYSRVARVTENTGRSITLDAAVPYAVAANATVPHRLRKVTRLASDVSLANVRFDHAAGIIPNANVWLEGVVGARLTNLSGRLVNLVNVSDSRDVTVTGVRGTLVRPHTAAGRVLTTWQSEGVALRDVRVSTAADAPVVFAESWNRGLTVDGIDVEWQYAAKPDAGVFHLTGGSTGTTMDHVVVDNVGPVVLVGSGVNPAQYSFGQVEITGPAKFIPLSTIGDLTWQGHRYTGAVTMEQTFEVRPGTTYYEMPLVEGAVRSVRVRATDPTSVRELYIINPFGQGAEVSASLLANQDVGVWMLSQMGSDYPFNDESMKVARLTTVAGAPARSRVTITTEYYPAATSAPVPVR